jgi:branched-chain amino acid transport system ATP-binding protein
MALSIHERGEGGPGTATGDLLVLDDLTIAYGRIRAVDRVSLTIPAQGCTAILGPNGAGKTTILRGVTGLVRPQSGHVLLDGVDVTRMRPFRIARLGVSHVQQGRGIFPRLTVDENIRAVAAGLDDVDVDTILEYFPRLAERGRQVAGTLSGGEQQMLALGLALLGRPRLMVVDEPSLGLAPQVVREIYDVFARLREQGTTLVIVEQFVHMLLGLADQVHVLQKGRVAFSGTPEALARGSKGTTELMGMYLGAGSSTPAASPGEVVLPAGGGTAEEVHGEPGDRVGRALLWMRRLEEHAAATGEPVETILARTLGTEEAGPTTQEEARPEEIGSYELLDGGWAACTTCDHRFRPVLLAGNRCPRCRITFAEEAGDLRGALARWWSERLRNPMFVLFVVVLFAFSQMVLLAFLLQVGD